MKLLTVPSSGSIAGQTNSRNRFGQYVRTRAIPVNPSTTKQAAIRAALTTLASNWRFLTAGQQLAWETYAQMHPRTDSLGQSVVLTGAQAYLSVGLVLKQYSAAAVVVPPGDPVFAVSDQVLTFTSTAGGLSITFTVPATDEQLGIYISPLRSSGVNFESDYRLLTNLVPADTSPKSLTTLYTARFGAPVVGAKVFLKSRQMIDGVLGPAYERQVIVA